MVLIKNDWKERYFSEMRDPSAIYRQMSQIISVDYIFPKLKMK